MATPIAEAIAVLVKQRLGVITTDDGYEVDVPSVERPKRLSTFAPRDFQLVVTQGPITPNPALMRPGNPPAIAWVAPFAIEGTLRDSETSTTAVDTWRNRFLADVMRAVTEDDTPNWWTWGGNAIDTTFGTVTNIDDEDGSHNGFQLIMQVTFRTDEGNPYNVRA